MHCSQEFTCTSTYKLDIHRHSPKNKDRRIIHQKKLALVTNQADLHFKPAKLDKRIILQQPVLYQVLRASVGLRYQRKSIEWIVVEVVLQVKGESGSGIQNTINMM
jgi:hypothetical protein